MLNYHTNGDELRKWSYSDCKTDIIPGDILLYFFFRITLKFMVLTFFVKKMTLQICFKFKNLAKKKNNG